MMSLASDCRTRSKSGQAGVNRKAAADVTENGYGLSPNPFNHHLANSAGPGFDCASVIGTTPTLCNANWAG
jgi:hypothetical protein